MSEWVSEWMNIGRSCLRLLLQFSALWIEQMIWTKRVRTPKIRIFQLCLHNFNVMNMHFRLVVHTKVCIPKTNTDLKLTLCTTCIHLEAPNVCMWYIVLVLGILTIHNFVDDVSSGMLRGGKGIHVMGAMNNTSDGHWWISNSTMELDLGEPNHTLNPCWMPKPLPPRNQCTCCFAPTHGVFEWKQMRNLGLGWNNPYIDTLEAFWANQPIHLFFVRCLNPCLQETSVWVGSAQPLEVGL